MTPERISCKIAVKNLCRRSDSISNWRPRSCMWQLADITRIYTYAYPCGYIFRSLRICLGLWSLTHAEWVRVAIDICFLRLFRLADLTCKRSCTHRHKPWRSGHTRTRTRRRPAQAFSAQNGIPIARDTHGIVMCMIVLVLCCVLSGGGAALAPVQINFFVLQKRSDSHASSSAASRNTSLHTS